MAKQLLANRCQFTQKFNFLFLTFRDGIKEEANLAKQIRFRKSVEDFFLISLLAPLKLIYFVYKHCSFTNSDRSLLDVTRYNYSVLLCVKSVFRRITQMLIFLVFCNRSFVRERGESCSLRIFSLDESQKSFDKDSSIAGVVQKIMLAIQIKFKKKELTSACKTIVQ